VFLDRAGTLIEDVGILSDPADICLFSDTIPTLTELQKDYLLFVVTNQNDIAKGLITLSQVEAVNAALDARMRQVGITGHGTRHRDDLPEGRHVFETLSQAGDWIANQ